jgi:hypothetical protein
VNGKGSIPVTAGDSLSLQWTVWPETHHGPGEFPSRSTSSASASS